MNLFSKALNRFENHMFPSVNFTITDVPGTSDTGNHSVLIAVPLELQKKLEAIINRVNTSSKYMTFSVQEHSSLDAKAFQIFETILKEKVIMPVDFLAASRATLYETAGPPPYRLCSATGKAWAEMKFSKEEKALAQNLRHIIGELSSNTSLEDFLDTATLKLQEAPPSMRLLKSVSLEIALRKNVSRDEVELTLCKELRVAPLMIIGSSLWNRWKGKNPPTEQEATVYSQIESWAKEIQESKKSMDVLGKLKELPLFPSLKPVVFSALVFTGEKALKLGTRKQVEMMMMNIIPAPLSSPLYTHYARNLTDEEGNLSIDLIAKMKALDTNLSILDLFYSLIPELGLSFHPITLKGMFLEIASRKEIALDEVLSIFVDCLPPSFLLYTNSPLYCDVIVGFLSQEHQEGASIVHDAIEIVTPPPTSLEDAMKSIEDLLCDEELHPVTFIALYNSLKSLYPKMSDKAFVESCPIDLTSPLYLMALKKIGCESELHFRNTCLQILSEQHSSTNDLLRPIAAVLLQMSLTSPFSIKALNDTLNQHIEDYSYGDLLMACRKFLEDDHNLMEFTRSLTLESAEYNDDSLAFLTTEEQQGSLLVKNTFLASQNITPQELATQLKEDAKSEEIHPVTFLSACNSWKDRYGSDSLELLIDAFFIHISTPLYPLALKQLNNEAEMQLAKSIVSIPATRREEILEKVAQLLIKQGDTSSFTRNAINAYLAQLLRGFKEEELTAAIHAKLDSEYEMV